METFLVILVSILLVALFGYVGVLYAREAGSNAPQLWLTGSRRFRQSFASTATARAVKQGNDERAGGALAEGATQAALAVPSSDLIALDDALRHLREELHGELLVASSRTREFDARLTRLEATTEDAPAIGEVLHEELAAAADRHRKDLDRLGGELRSVRQRAGSYGQRHGEALASLYASLARLEASLAAVVNPMLLPGEPLTIPAELPPDALSWNSWGDAGERAYAFGDIFNQHRLVLEPTTATEIAHFIATLRQALTGSVYPTVRDGRPTPEKIARMRAGLVVIAAELPQVRRGIERAYRDEPGSPEDAQHDGNDTATHE